MTPDKSQVIVVVYPDTPREMPDTVARALAHVYDLDAVVVWSVIPGEDVPRMSFHGRLPAYAELADGVARVLIESFPLVPRPEGGAR